MSEKQTKSPGSVADISPMIRTLADEREKLLHAVDKLLLREADGEVLAGDESELITVLNWSDAELVQEQGRCLTVRKWQARAGTTKQRSEAAERVESADKDGQEKLPALEAEQQQIQDQITAIVDEQNAAARSLNAMNEACAILRKFVPPWIIRRHNRRTTQIAKEFLRVPQLKTEITTTNKLLDFPHVEASSQVHVNAGKEAEAIIFHARAGSLIGEVDSFVTGGAWNEYLQKRRAELPELQREHEELLTARNETSAEADAALDYYLVE